MLKKDCLKIFLHLLKNNREKILMQNRKWWKGEFGEGNGQTVYFRVKNKGQDPNPDFGDPNKNTPRFQPKQEESE